MEEVSRLEWMRLGPFALRPRVSGAVVYDDNLTIHSRDRLDDLIWVVSAGMTAIAGDTKGGTGRILTLDYSPSYLVFTEHDEFNSLDHDASLNGIWPFARLTLGVAQTFDATSGGVVDVGSRLKRYFYNTALTSRYDLGAKSSFEVNARLRIYDYGQGYISSREWSNDNWFNYQLSSKINTGLGVTWGYLDPDRFGSQTYEQVLIRAVYHVAVKIDLTATFGGELRQYGDDGGDRLDPIFSITGTYWPRDGTSFAIEASRRNQNSAALTAQNYITTGIGLTARQRVWDRIFASVSGQYYNAEYDSARRDVVATRRDNYITVRAGVEASITDRWSAGVFYNHRRNNSEGIGAFDFSNNEVGLQTAYSF